MWFRTGTEGPHGGLSAAGTPLPSVLGYVLRTIKGALQLLTNRYGSTRFAQVPERGSTESFVVLIIGNLKSNDLGAQSTF